MPMTSTAGAAKRTPSAWRRRRSVSRRGRRPTTLRRTVVAGTVLIAPSYADAPLLRLVEQRLGRLLPGGLGALDVAAEDRLVDHLRPGAVVVVDDRVLDHAVRRLALRHLV